MAGATGLKPWLADVLMRAWQSRGAVALFLLPLTLLYYALMSLRRMLYRLGIHKVQSVNCAVIVVGNVVAGGAGKTPTVIGIVQHLRSRGLVVGVISRGYGRSRLDVRAVTPDCDAEQVGDEPLLISRTTGTPVFVASQRLDAAKALLAAHPHTQVIVCDDGLQHYAMHRDMEVCVFDDRGAGNGWLLPSGPLREPWPRLPMACAGQRADRLLVLHTGAKPALGGYRAWRSLSAQALAHDGTRTALRELKPPLLALAGIAKPSEFFDSLVGHGLMLAKTMSLPDHFDFSQLEAASVQGYQVLCTEKDAVKLWKHCPQALAVPLIQSLEPTFLAALDTMLDDSLAGKLSSRHGHQTA